MLLYYRYFHFFFFSLQGVNIRSLNPGYASRGQWRHTGGEQRADVAIDFLLLLDHRHSRNQPRLGRPSTVPWSIDLHRLHTPDSSCLLSPPTIWQHKPYLLKMDDLCTVLNLKLNIHGSIPATSIPESKITPVLLHGDFYARYLCPYTWDIQPPQAVSTFHTLLQDGPGFGIHLKLT